MFMWVCSNLDRAKTLACPSCWQWSKSGIRIITPENKGDLLESNLRPVGTQNLGLLKEITRHPKDLMISITPYGEVTRFDLSRTLLGRGWYWTTAYLVDDTLIDTGCAFTATEILRALEDFRLARVINTHSHEDHIGANGLLQKKQVGLQILAHPAALPVLADPRVRQPLHPYRRLFWGYPDPSTGQPLAHGTEIHSRKHCFQVIHTPGHSEDHLCLYEPQEGWLFTGDLFVGGRDHAMRAGTGVWEMIACLKRLAKLPARTLFPGSARVRENPSMELTGKAAYLEELGERVLQLHQEGRSVGEIAREVCGRPIWIEWITLNHFSRRELVLAYLSGENRLYS
jgi:glyoxylase-like metal-dependent hydrolase (beta-lactamase superfamily II)